MVAMDFFAASNSYDFFKSVLLKFAEKSDGENVVPTFQQKKIAIHCQHNIFIEIALISLY